MLSCYNVTFVCCTLLLSPSLLPAISIIFTYNIQNFKFCPGSAPCHYEYTTSAFKALRILNMEMTSQLHAVPGERVNPSADFGVNSGNEEKISILLCRIKNALLAPGIHGHEITVVLWAQQWEWKVSTLLQESKPWLFLLAVSLRAIHDAARPGCVSTDGCEAPVWLPSLV